jgi:hypothetical protein
MRTSSLIQWGASRAFRALVLIATLFLGATFHEWHHAIDPHCDGGAHGTEHACGCSGLHAAALAAASQDAPAPARIDWVQDAPASLSAPAAAAPALASPRAPPVA